MRFLFVCLCIVGVAEARAQSHRHHEHTTVAEEWALFAKQLAEPFLHPLEASASKDEQRFGYYGYRHKELHVQGLIQELQNRTKKSCCDNVTGGECRVSAVDLPAKQVFIDGRWCPIGSDTSITPLEGLSTISEPDQTVAIVCAARMTGRCAPAYCVGVESRM